MKTKLKLELNFFFLKEFDLEPNSWFYLGVEITSRFLKEIISKGKKVYNQRLIVDLGSN